MCVGKWCTLIYVFESDVLYLPLYWGAQLIRNHQLHMGADKGGRATYPPSFMTFSTYSARDSF